MYLGKKILGIIPARKGSKGIKDKNKKLLNQRPLVDYSVKTAIKSEFLTSICLSTDDPEILNMYQDSSAITLINRPRSLAADNSPTEEALIHALNFYDKEYGQKFDYIVILEPTSPFRTLGLIDTAVKKIIDEDSNSLVSLSEDYSSFGNIRNNRFILNNPDQSSRRQERLPELKISSTIFIVRTNFLEKAKKAISKSSSFIIVHFPENIDINDISDFYLAETILQSTQIKDAN